MYPLVGRIVQEKNGAGWDPRGEKLSMKSAQRREEEAQQFMSERD